MVKCPNCGSTAQVKLIDTTHMTPSQVSEKYECDCGALLIRHYKLQAAILYTDEGARLVKEDE
jgi:hypothetical protein